MSKWAKQAPPQLSKALRCFEKRFLSTGYWVFELCEDVTITRNQKLGLGG